jgi:N-acetylmuramoyl-L-alanine amidase
MTDQNTRLILSILMLVGALTVVTASFGWLGQDTTAQSLKMTLGGPDISLPAETSQPTTEASNLKPLAINLNEPALDPGNTMRRWPAESSLASIRNLDFSDYANRPLDNQPLAGITVFLDPGHGGSDSGATYPALSTVDSRTPYISEAKINLLVAERTRDQLQKLGATVYLIRDADVWQSIFYRIAYVSRYLIDQFSSDLQGQGYTSDAVSPLGPLMDQIMAINNDLEATGGRGIMSGVGAKPDLKLLLDIEYQYPEVLFLSIHCNSLKDDNAAGGLQVFYLSGDTAYNKESEFAKNKNLSEKPPVYTMYRDASRARLAKLIETGILDRIPNLKYNGQADLIEENYAVLRELNVTSALIELGFISSHADRAILQDERQQQVMAEAIAEAIYNFYCKSE